MEGTKFQQVSISTAGSTWAGSTIFQPPVVRTAGVKGFIFNQVGVSSFYMRNLLWLSVFGGLFIMHLSADTIQYQVSSLGSGEYQYTYYVSGSFNQYDFFEVDFDPTQFSSLSNPSTTAAGWDVSAMDGAVLQPQTGMCGPCDPGQYLPEYMDSGTSTGGIFTIDAQYTGSGQPGSQNFYVWQWGANGYTQEQSGTTSAYDSVPEPAGVMFSGMALLVLAAVRVFRPAEQ